MVDSATNSGLQSLQRANEELLKISENTFFSTPLLQKFSSSVKAKWLGGEELVNAFRDASNEKKLDEKVNALGNLDYASITEQNSMTTFKDKLIEKKNYIENQLEDIKEKQALMESTISVSLNRLENSQIDIIKQSTV